MALVHASFQYGTIFERPHFFIGIESFAAIDDDLSDVVAGDIDMREEE